MADQQLCFQQKDSALLQATKNAKDGQEKKESHKQYIDFCYKIVTQSLFDRTHKFSSYHMAEEIDHVKVVKLMKEYKIFIDDKIKADNINCSGKQNKTQLKHQRLNAFKKNYQNSNINDKIQEKNQPEDQKLAKKLFPMLQDFLQTLNELTYQSVQQPQFSLCNMHLLNEVLDQINIYRNGASKRSSIILQERTQCIQRQLKSTIHLVSLYDLPYLLKHKNQSDNNSQPLKDKKKSIQHTIKITDKISGSDTKENLANEQITKPNPYMSEQFRFLCELQEKQKIIDSKKSPEQQIDQTEKVKRKKTANKLIPRNRFLRQQIRHQNRQLLHYHLKRKQNMNTTNNLIQAFSAILLPRAQDQTNAQIKDSSHSEVDQELNAYKSQQKSGEKIQQWQQTGGTGYVGMKANKISF